MLKIIIVFFLIVNLNFAKEVILHSWKHDEITGKIKIEKKKEIQYIYVEGVGRNQIFDDINDEEEYRTKILIDTISKNYSIIDMFALDLNFDLDQELCLILKKEGKNYIKIYHYSFEDNKFYDFFNDNQKLEIQNLFLDDEKFTINKLKKYLNSKIPFVEMEYEWALYDLEKTFSTKNLLDIQNLNFLKYDDYSRRFIYVDNKKNYYYYFEPTDSRNIVSLVIFFEGEVDKNYNRINGIEYILSDGNRPARKRKILNKIRVKETYLVDFYENILEEDFYNPTTLRKEKTYIYRNGLLSKKMIYTYPNDSYQYKTVENYDDFKQVKNFYKNSKGDLKEQFKTKFNELDISKGKLLFESSDNKLYTIYDTENKKWCYVLMQKDANEWEYFYVKNIFNGIVSDLNLKNGMVDIIKEGYAEAYQNPYPVSLDSWSPIEEKGYYKNNKKNGIWIINYLHQIYSKVYYIRGVPICYWDYDGYDHLTEFGIYIYSKKIKIRRKKYFYGLSS